MRKKYFKLMQNVGIKQFKNLFHTHLSLRGFHTLNPPLLAILIPTRRCNLRCEMCDLWRSKEKEMTKDMILNVIDDLQELGVRVVSISGGEPLMRKDLFEIMNYIKEKRMSLDLSTNAAIITEPVAEKLVKTHVDTISISFDSDDPEIFDKLRGKDETYKKVIRGIKVLLEISKGKPSITANILISPRTLDGVLETVSFLRDLGLRNIGFIPVHNFSGKKRLRFSEEQKYKLKNVIDELTRIKKEYGVIDNTEKYLESIENFILYEKRLRPCGGGFFTIVIDSNGDVYPCFGMFESGSKIGNIRNTNIKDIWYSEMYKNLRYKLLHCNKCVWNCQEELNILFDRVLGRFA